MVARIATYSFTGDAQELGKRAEAGILPILKAQPGFKSYSVAIGEGKGVFVQRMGQPSRSRER